MHWGIVCSMISKVRLRERERKKKKDFPNITLTNVSKLLRMLVFSYYVPV